ncbi:hypothetical protein [Pseudogemmobacter sonorensis]|uniref:hypothetical protein n=1 Tax=Pseudogemmobacter sonorensis TaxID=2989681 RepID=UPI0036765C7F
MKIRTALFAVALTLAPGIAAAWDCGSKALETAALTCAEGSSYDDARGICVLAPTS